MLQTQTHFFSLSLSHPQTPLLTPNTPSLTFFHRPTLVSSYLKTRPGPWLAQITEPTTIAPVEEVGPIELPPSNSIFATNDDPSSLQVATSVLLTGAISVFLFRALRRRAKRVKELKFRSTGATKSLKDEALENLKAMKPGAVDAGSPPSPIQALLGAISAGVIALILYKFSTTVEASLNRQTISDNMSVRQLTITIRTIINGICYLATFVFGINSVGLLLYSGQLAINSIMGDPANTNGRDDDQKNESKSSDEIQSSDDKL